jgi:beta-amylase
MLADLRAAARAVGHPEWGHGGPHDAGHYNSRSWETGFFVSQGGNWQSEYGHFFLSWYRWVQQLLLWQGHRSSK